MMELTMDMRTSDAVLLQEAKDRLAEKGGDFNALNLRELLALLLVKGTSKKPIGSMIDEILNMKQEVGLKHVTVGMVQEMTGLSESKAMQVLAAIALGARIYEEPKPERRYPTPEAMAMLFMDLRHSEVEKLEVACFTTNLTLLLKKTLHVGAIASATVGIREILAIALRTPGTACIAIAHNHPSGSQYESKDDIDVTLRLNEACKAVGVKLLDHIVIADIGRWVSLKERGHIK